MGSTGQKLAAAAGAFLVLAGCALTPERARARIEARGLTFDEKGIGRAVLASDTDLIRLFIAAGYDVNASEDPAKAPLALAIRKGHGPTMDLLIEAGARAEGLRGVLCLPAAQGDLTTMSKLLDAGAVIDAWDTAGRTGLFSAIEAGRRESVQFLLDRGANVNGGLGKKAAPRGRTPLIAAVESNQPDLVELLLAGGADVNRVSGLFTPLMVAARRGNEELVDRLIAAGADPGLEYAGATAATAAARAGHHSLAARLEQAAAH